MTSNRYAINDYLDDDHSVTAVSMGWLRDHYNPEWDRLSAARANEISQWLTRDGIKHLPTPLPSRETAEVMLYRATSPIGVYISAARLEGPFEHSPAGAADILKSVAARLGTARHSPQEVD